LVMHSFSSHDPSDTFESLARSNRFLNLEYGGVGNFPAEHLRGVDHASLATRFLGTEAMEPNPLSWHRLLQRQFPAEYSKPDPSPSRAIEECRNMPSDIRDNPYMRRCSPDFGGLPYEANMSTGYNQPAPALPFDARTMAKSRDADLYAHAVAQQLKSHYLQGIHGLPHELSGNRHPRLSAEEPRTSQLNHTPTQPETAPQSLPAGLPEFALERVVAPEDRATSDMIWPPDIEFPGGNGRWQQLEICYIKGSHKALVGTSTFELTLDLKLLDNWRRSVGIQACLGWMCVRVSASRIKVDRQEPTAGFNTGSPPCLRYVDNDQVAKSPCVALVEFDLRAMHRTGKVGLVGDLRWEWGTNRELQFMLKKQGSRRMKVPNKFLLTVCRGWGPLPAYIHRHERLPEEFLQEVEFTVITIQKKNQMGDKEFIEKYEAAPLSPSMPFPSAPTTPRHALENGFHRVLDVSSPGLLALQAAMDSSEARERNLSPMRALSPMSTKRKRETGEDDHEGRPPTFAESHLAIDQSTREDFLLRSPKIRSTGHDVKVRVMASRSTNNNNVWQTVHIKDGHSAEQAIRQICDQLQCLPHVPLEWSSGIT